jgi:hypothetical protein
LDAHARHGLPWTGATFLLPQDQDQVQTQQQRAVWLLPYMNFANMTDPDKEAHTLAAAVNAKLV